jgi:hypothetical protein
MPTFSEDDPPRGVVWHAKQKAWRVRVKKMDHTVTPSREREFYHEFAGFETAIRVRDYVSKMLHGSNAKLHTDGSLPPEVTRVDIIRWVVKQGTIDADEVPHFMARVKPLDRSTHSG